MKKIGVVGLGIMGRGIVSNFLKNGYQVFIWNRNPTVAQAYVRQGAILCNKPSEVARSAEIIFEVTANDESSRSVWMGEEGILSGAHTQSTFFTCATLSLDWVDQLAQECEKLKIPFFDMPMTGGRVAAESGNLTLLCGGDELGLENIKPILAAIAQKILYFGPVGSGMRYKLILNFLQAVHIVGFGQAMKMASKYEMDLKKVSEALVDRPGGVITGIAQKAFFSDPDPITFSVEWISKDLKYAKEMAGELPVGMLDEAIEVYEKALQNGMKNKDWASVNTLV